MTDFVNRLNAYLKCDKKVLESIAKCGGFESIEPNRRAIVESAELIVESLKKDKKNNVAGQISLFDYFAEEEEITEVGAITLKDVEDYSKDEKLALEKEFLSFYVSGHPLDKYDDIMNYEFMVYVCEGSESEKLDWFKVVNIAGEKLTDQELRNSVYTGKWLTDAKRYFSKRNCAAKGLSDKYIKADSNRQELLEKALIGICGFQGIDNITEYMSMHKSDEDADELWQYFQDVINWVQKIFPKYYKDMKGLDWCSLYNKYHNNTYNSSAMKTEVEKLHQDDEVQKQKGIYEYLLCKDKDPFADRLLNLRAFDNRDKMATYDKQHGLCNICGEHFEYDEMEGDHIKPWSKGGRTILDNCQMLCKSCNAKKTDKY